MSRPRRGADSSCPTRSIKFFFHAEDGIRDLTVTGVQTCALPISFRKYASLWPFAPQPYMERSGDRKSDGLLRVAVHGPASTGRGSINMRFRLGGKPPERRDRKSVV